MPLHDTTLEIPVGFCQCGCGGLAPIAPATEKAKGWVKGQPKRFINNHHSRKYSADDAPNPGGLCACGCGQSTPLAKRSNTNKGYVKGQAVRFVIGHHSNPRPRSTPEERFWKKVDKRDPDECWEWQGSRDNNGYGRIGVGPRNKLTHVFAYELQYGPVPEGKEVCHSCDNPPCCNPKHLWEGTRLENMEDRHQKGGYATAARGERSGRARFTNAQVRRLRQDFAEGDYSIAKFARLHDVHSSTMAEILSGHSYQDA